MDLFSIFTSFFTDIVNNIQPFLSNCLNFSLNSCEYLIKFFFGWVNLPDLPYALKNSVLAFEDLIFDNIGLLGFFIRPSTLVIAINVFLILFAYNNALMLVRMVVKRMPLVRKSSFS